MEFQRARYYFHLLRLRYLWKPNESSFGLCMDGYHPRLESLGVLDRTVAGWVSRSAKNQRQLYWAQTFQPKFVSKWFKSGISGQMKVSVNTRSLEPNCIEDM